MQIKKLVKESGTTKDTIRYYERINLIPKPYKLANGYRDYSTDIIKKLKFIKLAQTVGFTLKQIKPALPYVATPKPNCPFLQDALNNQLQIIDSKIKALTIAKEKIIDWRNKNQNLTES